MGGSYFLLGSNLDFFWKILEKRPFFQADKYGRIGEIPHGPIWPDWGL